jgi:pimeloyl-ACP methyl ester carboxylesterase
MIEKVVQLYGPIKGYLAHSFAGIALSLAIEKTMHNLDTHIVLIAPATETATAVDAAFTMLNIQNTAVRKEFDNIIFERSGHTTEWFSIKRAMQQISASVLWIHDEEDDITPLADALQVKKEHFPNIRFIITKGLGHKKIYRDITVKKEIVDFL